MHSLHEPSTHSGVEPKQWSLFSQTGEIVQRERSQSHKHNPSQSESLQTGSAGSKAGFSHAQVPEAELATFAHDLVVVGSGPGGLQTSYCLGRLGVRHAAISADPGPGGMFRRVPLFERLISWTHVAADVPLESRAFEAHDQNSLVADEPELRALAASLGLSDVVRFAGEADQVGDRRVDVGDAGVPVVVHVGEALAVREHIGLTPKAMARFHSAATLRSIANGDPPAFLIRVLGMIAIFGPMR